jgi:glycosyltransferase involved in cell wall biosynthesis
MTTTTSNGGQAAARSVCMVVHKAYPPDPRVEREVRVALDAGYRVDVVAMRRRGEPARERVDGANVVRLPVARKGRTRLARVVWEYLGFTTMACCWIAARTLRRRYDVIHVNNPPDFLALVAVVPKLFGARVIFDIHDFAPELFLLRFGGHCGGLGAERALAAIERLATRFSDDVVTVHEPYRRALVKRGVPVSKITVVMNSVDEALIPSPVATQDSGPFRVVYHGTIAPHYGVDLLVEATARVVGEISNLQLEIYGDGDALPTVRARAGQLGILEHVMFSGRIVPLAEVLRLVRSADVGVVCALPIPRNQLAIPTKLFEYVALGIPVVSVDLLAIREHFSEQEILFFRGGDAEDLAATLLAVARDPAAAACRVTAARRRYEAYRWPISARRYAAVLAGSRQA